MNRKNLKIGLFLIPDIRNANPKLIDDPRTIAH